MKIGQDLFVDSNISNSQIDQLITYGQTDPEIKKFTSDTTRFQDRLSFNQWLLKDRTIYTLIDKYKNLLGIIWFGPKSPPVKLDPKYNFTFAIRIYAQARGQGLSSEFMKIAFDKFLKNQPRTKTIGFWLETSDSNFAAIHTYQKFGFKTITTDNHSMIMVL